MVNNWWKRAVVYQIYPRSFRDSNGDGIGDLRGITEKLDYLETLGVNVVWLSPVYRSPMDDNGYDISDYYHVDPCFGTDEDMDTLIREAGKRGIRIVMDLVVNHCSDEHEWFQKAKADPEGEYGKYFYIRKGNDGGPPNNWRSIFGGSAWEPLGDTPYYYLHLFTKKQVDLNWENPTLREEIYRMVNWWLDKGIAGFRLDAITYLKKEEGLPSYPADGADGLVSVCHGSLNRPGIEVFLRELKDRTYGRVNAMTVGETAGVSDEELIRFISEDDGYFSMIFDFSYCELNLIPPNNFWYETREWTPDELKGRMFHSHALAGDKGWLGVCMENHDQARSVDHYLPPEGRNFYGASMLAVMYLMLRGTPFIYQGQELGMRNCPFPSIGEYDDCSSVNQYHRAIAEGYSPKQALKFVQDQSRDNARTPFQWDDSENAGFTDGRPWLRVNDNYREINAARESEDGHSLLAWYRELIRLRRDSEYSDLLCCGSIRPMYEETENVVSYLREYEGRRLLVVCNYQNREQCLEPGCEVKHVVKDNYGSVVFKDGILSLRPFEAAVLAVR